MSIRTDLATASAGLARWGLRTVLKRNGGVLPGRVALAIDPDLIASLAGRLDASAVITGTNGKTTTTNLVADALAAAGASVVCNRAGNNMEPGIAGAMLEKGRFGGKRKSKENRLVGVFECDELYTVRVLPKLKPTVFVLLNLFRDQLDRYGEIDHTQDVIARALASSPGTVLLFNADDPLCAAIADHVPNPKLPFGIEGATDTETTRISESRFCARCNAPLDYDYVQYGQLGTWKCPSCGWKRPELARRAEQVTLSCKGYEFDLSGCSRRPDITSEDDRRADEGPASAGDIPERIHIETSYNGLYMVYNIAAAYFAAVELGAPADGFQHVLDDYTPAGGRMAAWRVGGRAVQSNLAKNPVGFDRQIQQIKTAGGRLAAFFLNDNDADGHDVSWIWDVDFERIAGTPGLIAFAGGTRAHDMQVRLKYAGIDARIVPDIECAVATLDAMDAYMKGADGSDSAESQGASGEHGAGRGRTACDTDGETLYTVANYTAFPPLVRDLERLEKTGAAPGKALGASEFPVAAVPRGGSDDGTGEMGPAAAQTLDRPLRIVHLYPDALNLYGDGGNAIAVERRLAWRGIPARVDEIRMGEDLDLEDADIVLMGGGSDRDQLSVAHELLSQRGKIAAYIEDGGAMLAICGSYQLMGRSYYMGDTRVEGLGVIGVDTVRGESRLIGNVAVATDLSDEPFVGFENHGGRTHLDADETPLGRAVVEHTGNNGEDGFEGVIRKGFVGTYLHGPALPKNPALTDWLITRALERRSCAGDEQAAALLPLAPLDDTCEHEAHDAAMALLGSRR